MKIIELINLALQHNASDLHLSAGMPPIVRIDGRLQKFDLPIIEQAELAKIVDGFMNAEQQQRFKEQSDLDFALQFENACRLRINLFKQMRGFSAVFRIIPSQIKSLDELQFPAIFKEIASYSKGLVLVTGPSGSGKSTTLAALIDYINKHYFKHIITVEDPIEFNYESANCLIHQREVHRDTPSFKTALVSALREDPNIILLGELRCHETIRLALTAAETGHLVFATVHTNSASTTINRLIDAFSGNEKNTIRTMLADSLQAVIAQTLVPRLGGGRIAAFEIMISNPAIKNLIREDKIAQIYSVIQTGQQMGMNTFEQYLTRLVDNQLITI